MSTDHSTHTAREIQLLEHSLQQLLMQRQSLQLELSEITNALSEMAKSSDDVYRVMGNIMVKAEKSSLSKELNERKKQIENHIAAVDKQESLIVSKAQSIKDQPSDGKSAKK